MPRRRCGLSWRASPSWSSPACWCCCRPSSPAAPGCWRGTTRASPQQQPRGKRRPTQRRRPPPRQPRRKQQPTQRPRLRQCVRGRRACARPGRPGPPHLQLSAGAVGPRRSPPCILQPRRRSTCCRRCSRRSSSGSRSRRRGSWRRSPQPGTRRRPCSSGGTRRVGCSSRLCSCLAARGKVRCLLADTDRPQNTMTPSGCAVSTLMVQCSHASCPSPRALPECHKRTRDVMRHRAPHHLDWHAHSARQHPVHRSCCKRRPYR